jgi:hypothetical protein
VLEIGRHNTEDLTKNAEIIKTHDGQAQKRNAIRQTITSIGIIKFMFERYLGN